MEFGKAGAWLAAAALVVAPVGAQTVPAPQPQAEEVAADAALRGNGLLIGAIGAVALAVLLLLTDGNEAEPQPAPPPVSS